jgi:flagellin-specific chaperone FliS
MVATQQRFRKYGEHCPICEGHAGLKQGKGERCAGYMSDDGEYVYCTREEFAGTLERNEKTQPAAFCHKMHGPCNCGTQHGPDLKIVPPPSKGAAKSRSAPDVFLYDDSRATARYPFYDEKGALLYTTVRFEWEDTEHKKGHAKTYRQFRHEQGKHVPGLTNPKTGQPVRRVLYRLPDLLKADPGSQIFIVEGENKVDALRQLGLLATCCAEGAGKWRPEYSTPLKGHRIIILPDNDEAGERHAQDILHRTRGVASMKIVTLPDLPESGDVIDWLKADGTREQLETLCTPRTRTFTYASEVKEEPVDWLWKRRIAKGCFTLLVGDPGQGKSTIIANIIAANTTGRGLPDNNEMEQGGVILMSPEDSMSMTVVPRLRAAGVNLKKVLLLNEVEDFDSDGQPYMRPVSFPEDADILAEAIEHAGATLAVIDPVLSMLSGKVDAHKDHAVRQALTHVTRVADQHKCALLGVVHLNKGQNANALYRSSSSIAFIAMARVGLFVVPDPDSDEGGGVLVNHKNNLAPTALSLRYSFKQTDDEIGYITWEGESAYSDSELLNQNTPTNNKRSEQADDLVAILKQHSEAMTAEEIIPLMRTSQTLSALQMMLSRKVGSELMRVARGKYTYIGNPLYDVNVVNNVDIVNTVKNVKNDEKDVLNILNINNITFEDERLAEVEPVLRQQKALFWANHGDNDMPTGTINADEYLRRLLTCLDSDDGSQVKAAKDDIERRLNIGRSRQEVRE